MQFHVLDTEPVYRRLLAAPDADARAAIFRAERAAPFAGLAQRFGQRDPLAAFAHWGMAPEQFAPERHAEQAARLDARAIFRTMLQATGFDTVRRSIFGGDTHTAADGTTQPIPPLAGYALGYKLVRAYLQRTGRSVVEASLLPAEELIAASRFFSGQ